jgi:Leucine-rich repeat (LRR) protein
VVNLADNLLTGTLPATLSQLHHVPLIWDFADNQFTGIDPLLCSMDAWMQGQVALYGCYALMCPRQTYHPLGHESAQGGTCWSCPTNTRFWASTTCAEKAQDDQILQELYTATQGSTWVHQDGWAAAAGNNNNNNSSFCTWYGISCWDLGDARDGRVRAIRLPFNNLVGTLPDSVYQLAQLTLLDVSSNTLLTVSLSQVQVSPHLQVLNIGHTNTNDLTGLTQANGLFHHLLADHLALRGPLPSLVLGLKNLKTLSLASCQLTGTLPLALGQLTMLEELYLYDNEFQGTLPATTLDQMTSLRIVSLAQNALTGTIPELTALTNLQAFSLYDQVTKGGGLDGPVPAFEQQTDLTSLQLAMNQLNGTVPATLLTNVNANFSLIVDLSHNTLTGTVPGSLSRFSYMNMYLEDNQITSVDSSLCLSEDWMSGAVAAYGCNGILCPVATTGGRRQFDDLACDQCPGDLSHLMGQTQCANVSSSSIGSSQSGLTQQSILQSLYSSCGGEHWHTHTNWNDTTTSVCDWYGIACDETESVTSITLGSNQLTGSVPSEIFLLPQLQRLSFFANPVAFPFEGIENAQNLQVLILDETGLPSLAGVGNAVGLRQLNVRFNQLAGPIPAELSQLTNIQALGLSGNALTGSIPTWFSQLTLLQDLLIANNQLSGALYDFQGLSFLQYLDLSDNHLTGTVPENLLPSLPADQSILVDLSKNYLLGTLSAVLASRGKGLSVDLQDNQIEAVDTSLCSSSQYQCDGILCPIGTYNPQGRQTNADTPCQPCSEAKFMGSTQCGNKSSASRAEAVWMLFGLLLCSQLLVSLSGLM